MDEENFGSWASQPDVCRCCLSASGTWDVTASYITEAGIKEVYSEMLQECYGISLSHLVKCGQSRMVCSPCVGQLRDASNFRRQVEDAERQFVTYCSTNTDILNPDCIKTELDQIPDNLESPHCFMNIEDNSEEHEVDLEALSLLDDEQIRVLIPAIGPQAKFKRALLKWNASKLNSDVTECSKIYDNLENLVEVYGENIGGLTNSPRSSALSSPSTSSSCKSMSLDSLTTLLEKTPDGLQLLKERQQPLGEHNRKVLVREIATHTLRANPKAPVTAETYITWIKEINDNKDIIETNYVLLQKSKLNKIRSTTKGKRQKTIVKEKIKIRKNALEEALDSDTPIAELSKKNVLKVLPSKDENAIPDGLLVVNGNKQLQASVVEIGFQYPRGQNGVKQVSERKRVMLTCDTVLRDTTACPFRHHKSWFQCFFCPQEFMEISLLREHMLKTHTDIDVEINKIKRYPRSLQIEISHLECRQCNLNLTDVISMCRHFVDVHKKVIYKECIADYKVDASPYSCHLCGQQFHVFRTLTTHLNEHYANCICDVCGKSFLNSKRLKVHKRTHENGNFPCTECGKVLKTKTSKANHMESAHSKRVIKCQICCKPMKHYNDRIKHMSEAHNITHKFKCPICAREYNIKHYLATHIRQTHGQKNKNCSECGMAFITNHGLKKHMLKHTGLKPFSCKVCCKSYARSYTLREHMRVHDTEKQFVEAD